MHHAVRLAALQASRSGKSFLRRPVRHLSVDFYGLLNESRRVPERDTRSDVGNVRSVNRVSARAGWCRLVLR